MSPGILMREARRRHGVSQQSLARRASTTQSAISRIERGRVSPTLETLTELLRLLGEDLQLGWAPRQAGIDRTLIDERLKLTEAERLDYGTAMADQLLEMSPVARRGS